MAPYKKAFTEVARVTLETDTAGNQLQEASDVKVRGVIVGEVREVEANVEGATIELAIKPEYLDQIPADVTARLLPKTLFGERFVSLRAAGEPEPRSGWPTATSSARTAPRTPSSCSGSSTTRCRCCRRCSRRTSSFTLGAIADALRGRGDDAGRQPRRHR